MPARLSRLLLSLALAGCAGVRVGPPPPPEESVASSNGSAVPAYPAAAGRQAGDRAPSPGEERARRQAAEEASIESALQQVASKRAAYTIGSGDLLEIAVYQEPDLQRTVRVSPDGTITMPMAGEIRVGSLSVALAERAIHRALTRYIVKPQVSVFIREYANQKVYVLGQVRNPGSYALPEGAPLTAIGAVALAGGFSDYAASNRTRVIRTRSGTSETFIVELKALTQGAEGSKDKDFRLEPNDVVFVPESFF